MQAKEKAAKVAGTGTASKTTFDRRNDTKADPLIDWFNLAKPSRNRQQKRGWKRSPRGRIDPTMAAQLALLAVFVLLFVGGVSA